VALLRRRAGEGLLDVVVLDPVEARGVVASSSGIRKRIAAGDVAGAATLLGRPFSVAGTVAAGAGRGTGLGFPTANLVPEGETRPANGIYACRADTDAGSWPAAVHLGPVPTFGAAAAVVEAHLVGFSGDLLGRRVRVHFLERLRDVTRFPDVEALKAAIADDVRRTVEVCIGLTVDG
jgi:riboflavin kinase/FMN adenylyltransferase